MKVTSRYLLRGVFALVALGLTACAELKLEPPGPQHQTVLVLPVKFENHAMNRNYYWDFFYEIGTKLIDDEPLVVRMRLPIKEGMVLVDSLPPGRYQVDKFYLKPKGAADHGSGNSTRYSLGKFNLEQGKITVFDQSLNITIRNETPGRIGEILTRYGIYDVDDQQKAEIRETLSKLDNFKSWSFAE